MRRVLFVPVGLVIVDAERGLCSSWPGPARAGSRTARNSPRTAPGAGRGGRLGVSVCCARHDGTAEMSWAQDMPAASGKTKTQPAEEGDVPGTSAGSTWSIAMAALGPERLILFDVDVSCNRQASTRAIQR